MLLNKEVEKYIGKNKRLGTHYHRDENGEIYSYFPNRITIQNEIIHFYCTTNQFKAFAISNMKNKEFNLYMEHTIPYQNHNCAKTCMSNIKQVLDLFNENKNFSDLQLIYI